MALFTGQLMAQVPAAEILKDLNAKIDNEQNRIDLFDKVADRKVSMKNAEQTSEASNTYLELPNLIQLNISISSEADLQKAKQLRKLLGILEGVKESQYLRYNGYFRYFDGILKIQNLTDEVELLNVMNNHLNDMMGVVPFYENKSVALPFLMQAAVRNPRLLMQSYKEFEYQPYSKEVIRKAINTDPDYVKNYLSSLSPVYYAVKAYNDPLGQTLMAIYNAKGSACKAYVLAHEIAAGNLSIEEADSLSKNDRAFFQKLIALKRLPLYKSNFSVDHELEHLSLTWVRKLNEMHETKDEKIRFKSVGDFSDEELYTLIIYTEDEIFTSTFLGLYKRLMERMTVSSSAQFLSENGMNRYRRFLKMCAGYNTLSTFLAKMSILEKELLLRNVVSGLKEETEILRSTAAIADIYNSLDNQADKEILTNTVRITTAFVDENTTILKLLLELMLMDDTTKRAAWLDDYLSIKSTNLFEDGKSVQQHFFFNDADGINSYNSFVASLQNINWSRQEFANYLKITSVKGKKIEIYVNKPQKEYAGQDDIRKVFETTKRWPDMVVHRGHSFYAQTAIESVTPSASLVILGSCGSYQNVYKVLTQSPKAAIIATKQVGTMYINNQLLYHLNETLRTGKDLEWAKLWAGIEKQLGANKSMQDKFSEYIAPDKNLGAIFLRRYNEMY
jgi:hypothetical protein